jgi:hypothetical protein
MNNTKKKKNNLARANVYFFGGLVLFVLLALYLLFEIYFWTGMGFRNGPSPTSMAYWDEFLRTSVDVLAMAMTSLWFITYPVVGVLAYGLYARRKHGSKVV